MSFKGIEQRVRRAIDSLDNTYREANNGQIVNAYELSQHRANPRITIGERSERAREKTRRRIFKAAEKMVRDRIRIMKSGISYVPESMIRDANRLLSHLKNGVTSNIYS